MAYPVLTILCADTPLDPATLLISAAIRREINRIPEASLVLGDGTLARGDFTLSDATQFLPGASVSLKIRAPDAIESTLIFDGLVVRQALEATSGGTRLRVDLKDRAFTLTRERRHVVFRDQSDDEAIRTLLGRTDVQAGDLQSTRPTYKELIQYGVSDWDFILSRADVQGLMVDVHLGVLTLAAMGLDGGSKRTLEYGLDEVLEFEIEVDASRQWAEVSAIGWDLANQQPSDPAQASQPGIAAGNTDASAMARKLGGQQTTLYHPVPLEPDELQAWADARLLRSRLAVLRGRLQIPGDADINPMDAIELLGIGARVDGPALVSAVTQLIDDDGWKTELHLGLSPEWFARQPDIVEVPAGGLLPPIMGLQVAKVAPFEDDPLGEHRIKLSMPALDEKQGAVWARVVRPDAGKDRGFAFWPEPDDEVLVGFLDGDPRQAVILGAFHGSANTPPEFVGGPSDANDKRAIVSKSGAMLTFDDDKVNVGIETPGGQKVLLDDDAKQITLTDQHGNEITMSDKGITLKSASDFSIEASGKVVIKGSAVDIQ